MHKFNIRIMVPHMILLSMKSVSYISKNYTTIIMLDMHYIVHDCCSSSVYISIYCTLSSNSIFKMHKFNIRIMVPHMILLLIKQSESISQRITQL